MKSNITLDNNLLIEAFKYANVKTEKELIILALKEFIISHKNYDIKNLKGKIEFIEDYDYKKMREGKL